MTKILSRYISHPQHADNQKMLRPVPGGVDCADSYYYQGNRISSLGLSNLLPCTHLKCVLWYHVCLVPFVLLVLYRTLKHPEHPYEYPAYKLIRIPINSPPVINVPESVDCVAWFEVPPNGVPLLLLVAGFDVGVAAADVGRGTASA